jgi:hypothetical protein
MCVRVADTPGRRRAARRRRARATPEAAQRRRRGGGRHTRGGTRARTHSLPKKHARVFGRATMRCRALASAPPAAALPAPRAPRCAAPAPAPPRATPPSRSQRPARSRRAHHRPRLRHRRQTPFPASRAAAQQPRRRTPWLRRSGRPVRAAAACAPGERAGRAREGAVCVSLKKSHKRPSPRGLTRAARHALSQHRAARPRARADASAARTGATRAWRASTG